MRIPTVNSLAFLYEGKPAVGVSLEAVEANLTPRRAEAMMAHELASTPLLLFWAAWRSRFIGRHNGLLADSIAAKLTYDPEGLKETIEELDRLFMENTMPFKPEARYPYYLFVYRVRPELELARARKMAGTFYSEEQEEDFAADMDKWVTRMSRFPRDTLEMRLRNLEAIELGHWPAFEKK